MFFYPRICSASLATCAANWLVSVAAGLVMLGLAEHIARKLCISVCPTKQQ